MLDFISDILASRFYFKGEEIKCQVDYLLLKDKHESLKLFCNESAALPRIEGNQPCYKGRNFSFCEKFSNDSIKSIMEQLNADIQKTTVKKLEYGVIVEVPFSHDEIMPWLLRGLVSRRTKSRSRNLSCIEWKTFIVIIKEKGGINATIFDERDERAIMPASPIYNKVKNTSNFDAQKTCNINFKSLQP